MKPTAMLCGTAMLICYAVLGTIWAPSWYLVPVLVFGGITLMAGFSVDRKEG